jgi:hypothetical protein
MSLCREGVETIDLIWNVSYHEEQVGEHGGAQAQNRQGASNNRDSAESKGICCTNDTASAPAFNRRQNSEIGHVRTLARC